MFKTILVPLDGSSLSEKALPVVCRLGKTTGAQVVLLRAAGNPAAVQEAGTYLSHVATRLADHELKVEKVVSPQPPMDAIIYEANTRHADLIIMGTHGRSGLNRAVFGSVSEQILAQSDTPLLLVRSNTDVLPMCSTSPRMLVSLDESPFAEAALPHVARLVRALEGTVVMLNVVIPVPEIVSPASLVPSEAELRRLLEGEQAVARTYLERVTREYFEGLPVEMLTVVDKSPAKAIQNACAASNISCVIMSTHGRTGLQRVIHGSVADEVLHHLNQPVMLMHPGAKAFAKAAAKAEVEAQGEADKVLA